MYSSIETRWFFPEKAMEAGLLKKWFSTFREWPDEGNSPAMTFQEKNGTKSLRTDHYLDVGGYPNLSIKIREGKMEVKLLDKDYGLVKFHPRAIGRVGKWIKWGTGLKNTQAGPEFFTNPGEFKAVTKERLLIKYEIRAGKKPLRINPDRLDIRNGCQVELTKLQYEGKTFFSFGFEAWGEEKKLMKNFRSVCVMTLQSMSHIRLAASTSYGYPVFLSK